ncbi:MAG: lysylphosphatidylglycerol synthase transmembrane domain-containing protein [Streptosporangiaceae bacterium]
MRTDPAKAGRPSGAGTDESREWRGWWRRLRGWLPFLVKPLRRGIVLFIVALVIEYLVVPELVGASKDLSLLGRVNAGWLIAGVITECLSLFCYGLLTRAVLSPAGPDDPPRPGLSRLFRIDLAAAAIAHVIPAGTLGSAGIGYRLFTAEGIKGNDAAVMMATKGLGSTVMLNVLLWLSLVVSIPLAGFHPIYVTVAAIGAVLLLAIGALTFGITHEIGRASRILHAIGDRIPGLTGARLEQGLREASTSLTAMARDRRTMFWSLTWAALNWLLDAGSLWCFVAAFGRFVNPVELFAAYGIANVAGVLPITPAGLGVIDSVAPLLLVSFGVTRSVATLGVLGWRLVNFWLPIPAGAAAYVSLKVPRGAGLKAMRAAVSTMMTHNGQPETPPPATTPADLPPPRISPADPPPPRTTPADPPPPEGDPPDTPEPPALASDL